MTQKQMKIIQLTSYEDSKEAFRITQKEIRQIKDNEVLVKMEASPINPSDLMFIKGMYGIKKKLPVVPGFEGSGVIVEKGSAVENLEVGMKVSCSAPYMGDGTWAEYMITPKENCIPLMDSISLKEGATFFVNPLTARGLVEIAIEEKHQAIVQTAAASSLGKMIIKFAKRKSIPIINIVRREEQVEILQNEGAEHVLNSAEQGFDSKLRKLAKNLKATLLLDAVSGEIVTRVLNLLPMSSKAVIYGALSEEGIETNPGIFIFQNKKIEGFWLSSFLMQKGSGEMAKIAKEVQELIAQDFKTQIFQELPLDEGYNALEIYKNNMSKGKVLFVPSL